MRRPHPFSSGDWYKFDDDFVKRVSAEEAVESNYGTSDNARPTSPATLRLGAPGALPRSRLDQRFSNAYMLVYIRDRCAIQWRQVFGGRLEAGVLRYIRDRCAVH